MPEKLVNGESPESWVLAANSRDWKENTLEIQDLDFPVLKTAQRGGEVLSMGIEAFTIH